MGIIAGWVPTCAKWAFGLVKLKPFRARAEVACWLATKITLALTPCSLKNLASRRQMPEFASTSTHCSASRKSTNIGRGMPIVAAPAKD
jgi:hypothetical protein